MSAAASPPPPPPAPSVPAPELPAAWERLERAVAEAAVGLEGWRRRSLAAEQEVARLRGELEALARRGGGEGEPAGGGAAPGANGELRRLRAENAALRSRLAEAHQRVLAVLGWLDILEARR